MHLHWSIWPSAIFPPNIICADSASVKLDCCRCIISRTETVLACSVVLLHCFINVRGKCSVRYQLSYKSRQAWWSTSLQVWQCLDDHSWDFTLISAQLRVLQAFQVMTADVNLLCEWESVRQMSKVLTSIQGPHAMKHTMTPYQMCNRFPEAFIAEV